MPTLTVTTRAPAELTVDSLVIGSIEGSHGAVVADGHGLPRPGLAHIESVLRDVEAKGAEGEVHRIVSVPGVEATSVVVTGLGPRVSEATLRSAAGAALRSLASKKSVALALPAFDAAAAAAVADGAYAGCYSYVKPAPSGAEARETKPGPKMKIVYAGEASEASDAIARAGVVGAARDFARDLVNTPPNLLTPKLFVDAVRKRAAASPAKVTISVLGKKALARGGFGGILGVGQGSTNPPRIVTVSWTPVSPAASVALVGKGITFDSGGLCIKPPAAMATMKCDMAGAAAVAGAVLAAAELALPVAVTGYLCLAENMPGGAAQRPSDVVTMRNNKTVEILDTDAEGRMVLADGICLATESSPDAVVDIATLTGAQIIALGNDTAGVMSNSDDFRSRVVDAAGSAGELVWPMPLPPAMLKALESTTADIAHKGDRSGGMLTAGLFLGTFVPEGTPWAHLDIAGPAFNESAAKGAIPKGGTGFGVSTLVALAESYA